MNKSKIIDFYFKNRDVIFVDINDLYLMLPCSKSWDIDPNASIAITLLRGTPSRPRPIFRVKINASDLGFEYDGMVDCVCLKKETNNFELPQNYVIQGWEVSFHFDVKNHIYIENCKFTNIDFEVVSKSIIISLELGHTDRCVLKDCDISYDVHDFTVEGGTFTGMCEFKRITGSVRTKATHFEDARIHGNYPISFHRGKITNSKVYVYNSKFSRVHAKHSTIAQCVIREYSRFDHCKFDIKQDGVLSIITRPHMDNCTFLGAHGSKVIYDGDCDIDFGCPVFKRVGLFVNNTRNNVIFTDPKYNGDWEFSIIKKTSNNMGTFSFNKHGETFLLNQVDIDNKSTRNLLLFLDYPSVFKTLITLKKTMIFLGVNEEVAQHEIMGTAYEIQHLEDGATEDLFCSAIEKHINDDDFKGVLKNLLIDIIDVG